MFKYLSVFLLLVAAKAWGASPAESILLLSSPEKLFKHSYSVGTGFVVKAPNGEAIAVTNTHVCESSVRGVMLFDSEATGRRGLLHIHTFDTKNDLCLLDAPDGIQPLIIGKDADVNTPISIMGHPGGGPLKITTGVVKRPEITETEESEGLSAMLCAGEGKHGGVVVGPKGVRFTCSQSNPGVAITAQALPGNSGSPVLNLNGEVVGVVFAAQENGDRHAVMVPVARLRELISKF